MPTHPQGQASSSVSMRGGGRMEKFTFTLGKLDAGMAILLGPNAHLLEFPSLLLPSPPPGQPPLGPGSILTITVSRDLAAELRAQESFESLQADILSAFSTEPKSPVMKLRNVTQTSVCVEWEGVDVGSAGFRGLEMFRNGQRWGRVGGDGLGLGAGKGMGKGKGKGREKREWKTGGLQSGEEYTFQLILKTTAGTYPSNLIRVRTHTMDNITGIFPTFGPLQPHTLQAQMRDCLAQIGAQESQIVQLDTTHYICTTPIVGENANGRGGSLDAGYQEAIRMNLPVVGPGWLLAVAAERKMIPIGNYLLPAPPAIQQSAQQPAVFKRPEPLKRSSLPFTSSAPSSPIREHPEEIRRSPSPETIARMSMTGSTSGSGRSGDEERRSSREMSVPFGDDDRRRSMSSVGNGRARSRSREGSLPVGLEVVRPRSPRAEADGKLDRTFKFPLKSEGTAATVTSPTSATSGNQLSFANIASGDSSVIGRSITSDSTTSAPKETSTSESTLSTSPTSVIVPSSHADGDAVHSPPPLAGTAPLVTHAPTGAADTNKKKTDIVADVAVKAQTIDEAIKSFNEAVGHSERNEPKGGKGAGEPAEKEQGESENFNTMNGDSNHLETLGNGKDAPKPEEAVQGGQAVKEDREHPPSAGEPTFRRPTSVIHLKNEPVEQITGAEEDDGEGKTMDEIDLS